MAIKQVAQGVGSVFRTMWQNKGVTLGITGIGAAATLHGAQQFTKTGLNIPMGPDQTNPFNPQNFKNASFTERQSAVASLGMFNHMAGGGSAFSAGMGAMKGMADYNVARAKDIYATSGLPGQATTEAGAAARWGMKAGAIAGGIAGLAVGGLTGMGAVRGMLSFAGLGAVTGGYNARKVSLQVMESFNQAKKSSLNRNRMSNRARTGGTGFRSWTKGSRMGRPGHLGMDGTVPFSMHKARHRSTI
tara:strand:- start:1216 stop:1953 length:738 start_codon:yes stop_codon:yes gene_type:complete